MMPVDREETRLLLDKRLPVSSTRSLLHSKLLYFTLNMALYSSLTFTSAYFFEQWGLPIYQFGGLSALSVVELAGAVWWGGLADRTGAHRRILLLCASLYCGLFCLLPVAGWWLPSADGAGLKLAISTVLLGGTYFCMSAFFPLVDSCVLQLLEECDRDRDCEMARDRPRDKPRDKHAAFGRQRLWGTVGHALVTLFSAQAISHMGWTGMFVVFAMTCVAFMAMIWIAVPAQLVCGESHGGSASQSTDESREILPPPPANGSHTLLPLQSSLLRSFDFVFFLAVVLCTGYMRAVLSIFLPYHLLIDWQQTPLFVGFTAFFRISAEIAIFAWWSSGDRSGEIAREDERADDKDRDNKDRDNKDREDKDRDNKDREDKDRHSRKDTCSHASVSVIQSRSSSDAIMCACACAGNGVGSGGGNGSVSAHDAVSIPAPAHTHAPATAIYTSTVSARKGELRLVLIGLVAGVIRVGGYGQLERLLHNTGLPLGLLVFLLESLKGVSVACLISGAVRLAHDMVPTGTSTRAQALVSGTYSGLSTALSGVLGGGIVFALPAHNLACMFSWTAGGGLVAILIALIKYGVIDGVLI